MAYDFKKLKPVVKESFPEIRHGRRVTTYYVLVQNKYVQKTKDLGDGKVLHLSDTTRDVQRYTSDVAKVVAVGPMAWHNHETGEPIPGVTEVSPKVGDLVQVPSVGGKSFWVDHDGEREAIEFNYLRDIDVFAIVDDDSLRTVMGA